MRRAHVGPSRTIKRSKAQRIREVCNEARLIVVGMTNAIPDMPEPEIAERLAKAVFGDNMTRRETYYHCIVAVVKEHLQGNLRKPSVVEGTRVVVPASHNKWLRDLEYTAVCALQNGDGLWQVVIRRDGNRHPEFINPADYDAWKVAGSHLRSVR